MSWARGSPRCRSAAAAAAATPPPPPRARRESIFDAAAAAGLEQITCTPEFGPAEYVPQNGDGEPVCNVWEVNHWVGLEVQALYRKKFGEEHGRLVPDVGPALEKV